MIPSLILPPNGIGNILKGLWLLSLEFLGIKSFLWASIQKNALAFGSRNEHHFDFQFTWGTDRGGSPTFDFECDYCIDTRVWKNNFIPRSNDFGGLERADPTRKLSPAEGKLDLLWLKSDMALIPFPWRHVRIFLSSGMFFRDWLPRILSSLLWMFY